MTDSTATSQTPSRRFRVGIDVGGTFTDVVIIDNDTVEVVSQLKVPTTHSAEEGVARGIINAIERALADLGVSPDEVVFIAHSTTQATNALLEGDVAKVGVIGVGKGIESFKARLDTKIGDIELAPNRFLHTTHAFVKAGNLSQSVIEAAIGRFRAEGADVVAASEAFGVDDERNEILISEIARKMGLFSTSGHEVSTLYGLRVRTRTAVINGAILPKMIRTATMTDECVKQSGISAPLMIMRSDGGVMSVDEVQKRPIMTMLSGPAAGIAGALMYEKVSDGIFIEVGGTSADISVIRDGQPQMKAARVGGHRTYLNTLDVRTIAIAGGSMVREAGGKIVDVGSRSAHIAGLPYACFQPAEIFEGATIVHLSPTQHDSKDYVAVECGDGRRFALTPTCAANLLGEIPDDAFAKGSSEAARRAFLPLADLLGTSPEEAARRVLEISCAKVKRQISELIAEYQLDPATLELVGGGGGAAALVPFTAKQMGLPSRLARKAEVISTIGVALALVRDTVERNIVEPTPEDILLIRREAVDKVCGIGALPETVEVQVEVDTKRNLVRATAFGTTELKRTSDNQVSGDVTARSAAARSLKTEEHSVTLDAETDFFHVYGTDIVSTSFFGAFKRKRRALRVVDKSSVVRMQRSDATVVSTRVESLRLDLSSLIEAFTDFGDAGRTLPDIHMLLGPRIVNLSGLAEASQALALAEAEAESMPADAPVILIGAKRNS